MNVLVFGITGAMGQTLKKDLNDLGLSYEGIDPQSCSTVACFEAVKIPDVIIDFSHPDATALLTQYATTHHIPLVIGTTGHSTEAQQFITKASQTIPVFQSANMAYGVNLLNQILKEYTKALEQAYDIEIIEKHHNQKIDSPSGTALLLKNTMIDSSNTPYTINTQRMTQRIKRSANEIGIHAVRGGSITGEHTVIFAGVNDTIELTHKAHNKHLFTRGAIQAASYITQKDKGLYSMDHLIKERRG